jgi:WD40 repeat protein
VLVLVFDGRCVAFNDENIVSGSWDNTIKVWSTKTGKLKNTLDGHDGRVLHLDFDQNKIVRSAAPLGTREFLITHHWSV